MDDESRRSELLRRSFAWDTPLDRSGWPPPPSFWTEEHADEIRRNHGLEADAHLIPIAPCGAELGEAYRGLDLLIVGSPCQPDSLEDLKDIGLPRLTLSSLTPPHERRVLVNWLIRIEHVGAALRLERRVSLRSDEFIQAETVITDLGQRHTAKACTELRRRGLKLLDAVTVGRPPGATPGSKQEYWLARVDQIGEPAARTDYYAQTPRGSDRYDWWDDNILRTLRRRKHRQ